MLQFEILPDRKVLIVKPKEPLETLISSDWVPKLTP